MKIPKQKLLRNYKNNNFIDSPLVKINPETGIIIDMMYPKLGFKNSINDCLVRKEVLDKLIEAKSKLPNGYTFKIWDAYRPLSLQNELYLFYKDKIIKEFNLENLSKEEQDDVIKNYVSLPNNDIELPPLHSTGGSIDLTIFDLNNNKDLDLGVKFDEFTNLTNSDSFEEDGMDEVIRDNRRLLYTVMTSVGFTNLPSEIWHYDYGNRAWGFYKNEPAIYKGILDYKKNS